ncbi:MAG: glycosyltransferase family 39 protein [Anaerolineae bacterium]|nr:glycosyltransferase family 39 protein [Anaerolineae bacterium]
MTGVRRAGWRAGVAGLLLLLFALLLFGARQNTLTADEPAYIAGGYAVLARGRDALPLLAQRGYPPLLATVEALPLYLANPDVPVEQLPGWPASYDTFTLAFKPFLVPVQRSALAARMATILLTLLLGAVVFRWGADLWGPPAGLIALAVLVLDPTLLAHGRLAHSDVGATALGTVALFVVWRWSRAPSWRRAFMAGLLLALTLLAKVSGALWLAAAGLIVLATLWERRRDGRVVTLAGQGLSIAAVAGLVWWAAYGFAWGRSEAFAPAVPAPLYWDALQYLRDYTTDLFALGIRQSGHGGWWWYFPLAFLIKNPLPLLIALGIALIALFRRPIRGRRLADVVALTAFPVLYSLVAIVDGMTIGYRHMLPVHPFLYLAIGGGLAGWAWDRERGAPWRRWIVAGLGLWLAVGALRTFPWEISFFNELAGGQAGGYRYLADSNVDWGQAGQVQESYLAAHPDTQTSPPSARFNPAPGSYLVGASTLDGVGVSDVYSYEWFRHRQPDDVLAGGSRLVFDVPATRPAWLVQCTQPVAPLTETAIASAVDQPGLRTAEADCSQAWIYPAGGAAAGIYALHHDLLTPQRPCLPALLPCPTGALDPFTQRHLDGARLSYEQPVDGQLPAFALFERSARPLEATRSDPVALDGPLAFLSATAYRTTDGIEVETWWQAVDGPVERPFSLMGHLLDEQDAVAAVDDGLGLSPLALQPGDILVQRHRFPGVSGDSVRFETGAYFLDDLSRWPIVDSPDADSIVLTLYLDDASAQTAMTGGQVR